MSDFFMKSVKISLQNAWLFLKKQRIYLLGFLVVAVAFLAGSLYEKKAQEGSREYFRNSAELRQKGGYKFIDPLLECEVYDNGRFLKNKNLENMLKKAQGTVLGKSSVNYLAVYFRDLNNGPWISLNANEYFTPASLLKVPVMIAILKKEEEHPGFLQKTAIFHQAFQVDEAVQNIKPKERLIDGKEYTVEELLEHMIQDSDNDAAGMLLRTIDTDYLNKVYSDLLIPVPVKEDATRDFMTVQEYASFFRILYNASYLGKEMSEKALSILSKSVFENGLAAGVPKDTVVAHKFGERVYGGKKQLHDCGIVYNGSKTYLLCIMTRGDDFPAMEEAISYISKMVWDEVNAQ